MEARLTVCCWPLPIVTSVSVTPGICRMSAATRSTRADVAASVEPSGARTLTSNCDWSSTGRKFLPTNLKSGTMLKMTSAQAVTTTQRCAIENRSIAVYVRSIGLYQRDSFDVFGARTSCGSRRETSSEGGADAVSSVAVSYVVARAPGSPTTVLDSSASADGASASDGAVPVADPSAAVSRLMSRAASIGVSVNETK